MFDTMLCNSFSNEPRAAYLFMCFCFSSEKAPPAQLQATNAIQQHAGTEKREESCNDAICTL